jgi:hypothetical protein
MRDEHDYASMGVVELRQNLERVVKELSTWTAALANVKKDRHVTFLQAYSDSQGKSVAERRMDGELATAITQSEIIEYEGLIGFHTAIRDMIVVLLSSVTADV